MDNLLSIAQLVGLVSLLAVPAGVLALVFMLVSMAQSNSTHGD